MMLRCKRAGRGRIGWREESNRGKERKGYGEEEGKYRDEVQEQKRAWESEEEAVRDMKIGRELLRYVKRKVK